MSKKIIKFLVIAFVIGIAISYTAFHLLRRHKVLHDDYVSYEAFKKSISKEYFLRSQSGVIYIATVGCHERTQESLISIKSAILYSPNSLLHFIIFTEKSEFPTFSQTLSFWQMEGNQTFYFTILEAIFPSKYWRNLFKPCASLRLFLPDLLPNIDTVIYADTDTIFLAPPKVLWSKLSKFNLHHFVGMVLENATMGFYNISKGYREGNRGLNSGVMLMNLTRMRSFGWKEQVISTKSIISKDRNENDQDIINIILHYHPERVLVLPCKFNFINRHCICFNCCSVTAPVAANASGQREEDNGIVLVHGTGSRFHHMQKVNFTWIFSEMVKLPLFDGDQSAVLKNLARGRDMGTLCQFNKSI